MDRMLFSLLILLIACTSVAYVLWCIKKRLPRRSKGTLGIFHPHASGGGGGERVLWCAIQAVQEAFPSTKIVLYCTGSATPTQLVASAQANFHLPSLSPNFSVVPLRHADLLDPARYPRFTLIGQALGSAHLMLEALSHVVPEVLLDTTGCPFSYPVARVAGARVAAYVHYPTISTDMLRRVAARSSLYNNAEDVASSPLLSFIKLLYYYCFAALYALVAMVNSSWTKDHIAALWFLRWRPPQLVHPPCDTVDLQRLPLDRKLKRLLVLSVAQYRPEKNQELQLRVLAALLRKGLEGGGAVRLVFVGGVRGDADRRRLLSLQRLAADLGIQDVVDFRVGIEYAELKRLLGDAVVGLHSMVDEHFGISVVEYMAAGVVPIAHNSGGPARDIVPVPGGRAGSGADAQRCGYLCSSEEEYVEALTRVLIMPQTERLKMAAEGRRHVAQFSDANFRQRFAQAMWPLLQPGGN